MNNTYDKNFLAYADQVVGGMDVVNVTDPEFISAMKNLKKYYNLNKNMISKNKNKTRKISFRNTVNVRPITRMGKTQLVGENVIENPLPNNYPNRPKKLSSKTRKHLNQSRLFNTQKSKAAEIAAAEMANAFNQGNTLYEIGNLIHAYRNNNDPLTKMFVRKYGPRQQNYNDYVQYKYPPHNFTSVNFTSNNNL
jgi:hypothetical protein